MTESFFIMQFFIKTLSIALCLVFSFFKHLTCILYSISAAPNVLYLEALLKERLVI